MSTGGQAMEPNNDERNYEIFKERLIQLVDDFRDKIKNGTSDPESFMNISEIEHLWSELRGNTGILYSDMLEQALEEVNESEIISKKKRNT